MLNLYQTVIMNKISLEHKNYFVYQIIVCNTFNGICSQVNFYKFHITISQNSLNVWFSDNNLSAFSVILLLKG